MKKSEKLKPGKTSALLSRRDLLKISGAGAVSLLSTFFLSYAHRFIPETPSDQLANELARILQQKHAPGLAAAYVKDKELIAIASAGERIKSSGIPVTPDDIFHIGLCTMAMTSTMFAKLIEEGIVGWETKLSAIFPELQGVILKEYENMTPVHLLCHMAGVPGEKTPASYSVFQDRLWSYTGSVMEQRLQVLHDVLSQPPDPQFLPGKAFNLSNLGYIIAAAIAEKLTGKSWEDLMTEKLFEPLGMKSAGFGPPGDPKLGDQPWGHSTADCIPMAPGPKADFPPVAGPAGRVHVNMRDWAKFATLHLQGARKTEGLLLKPQTFASLQSDPFKQTYSFGWSPAYREWASGFALAHAGTNTYWYASIWIAPVRKSAFVAAANCGSDDSFLATDAAVGGMVGLFL
jgi:CubicO group peptidase (beta-lactamase class C family)